MKPPVAPVDAAKPFQWRLSTILLAMSICAMVLGAAVNLKSDEKLTARFASLPASDDALRTWFEKDFGASVSAITRNSVGVEVRYHRRSWTTRIPSPPWKKLGYHGLRSFQFQAGMPTRQLSILVMGGAVSYLIYCLVDSFWRRVTAPLPRETTSPDAGHG